MRIAFLCKRQYMRKDVITDRYARLYEQPRQLALLGHDVMGLCLSYRQTEARDEYHEATPGKLHWIGLAPEGLGIAAYPRCAESALRSFAPDLLVGASDSPHIVLGDWLARRLKIPYAVDLYDDFESFGLARIPGMRTLYQRAIRRAAVVSCVSDVLAKHIRDDYQAKGRVISLPSTIDRAIFRRLDRDQCRLSLGLPADAQLVGTAGALQREKGISPLYQAFERLSPNHPQLHLVLAGRVEPSCPPPAGTKVHCLGELPHAQTAVLFNALDVGVVYLRDTPYGRASFPQKAYEMFACGLPVVAAKVGAMEDLFGNTPNSLYQADSVDSLAYCIQAQLGKPTIAELDIRDWADLAREMELTYLNVLQLEEHDGISPTR